VGTIIFLVPGVGPPGANARAIPPAGIGGRLCSQVEILVLVPKLVNKL